MTIRELLNQNHLNPKVLRGGNSHRKKPPSAYLWPSSPTLGVRAGPGPLQGCLPWLGNADKWPCLCLQTGPAFGWARSGQSDEGLWEAGWAQGQGLRLGLGEGRSGRNPAERPIILSLSALCSPGLLALCQFPLSLLISPQSTLDNNVLY